MRFWLRLPFTHLDSALPPPKSRESLCLVREHQQLLKRKRKKSLLRTKSAFWSYPRDGCQPPVQIAFCFWIFKVEHPKKVYSILYSSFRWTEDANSLKVNWRASFAPQKVPWGKYCTFFYKYLKTDYGVLMDPSRKYGLIGKKREKYLCPSIIPLHLVKTISQMSCVRN